MSSFILCVFLSQIKKDKPEIVPNLRHLVMERFRNLESKNCNADLQRNEKVVLFKEQIKQMKAQCKCGFISKSSCCIWSQCLCYLCLLLQTCDIYSCIKKIFRAVQLQSNSRQLARNKTPNTKPSNSLATPIRQAA